MKVLNIGSWSHLVSIKHKNLWRLLTESLFKSRFSDVSCMRFPWIKQKLLFWQAVFSCNNSVVRYFHPHSQWSLTFSCIFAGLMNVWLFITCLFDIMLFFPLVSYRNLFFLLCYCSVHHLFWCNLLHRYVPYFSTFTKKLHLATTTPSPNP